MTDCTQSNKNNRTFESKVDVIDVNLESNTSLTKTLRFYDVVKTDADLTGVVFELVLFYMTTIEAFRKPLIVTGHEVALSVDYNDVKLLGEKEFILEVHRTENGATTKISEGKMVIT